jgi:Tfp pilus assembly protein PilO
MIFNNSKLLLVVSALVSAVLLAVLVLGVYKIEAKNKKTSELLILADHAAEIKILEQSVRIIQNNASEDLELFESFVLSDDKLVSLIESIEGAGGRLNLETSILSVAEVKEKNPVAPKIIRITMETRGSWSGTLSFLRAIESLPQRVIIDESNLSREEVGWRSRIVLSLYSFN